MNTTLTRAAAMALVAVAAASAAHAATLDLWLFDDTASHVIRNEKTGHIEPLMKSDGFTNTLANLHAPGGAFPQSTGVMLQPTSPPANYLANSFTASGSLVDWTQHNAFTIQMWVNPSQVSTSSFDPINYRGQILRLSDSPTDDYLLIASIRTGGAWTTTPFAGALPVKANEWSHIAMTWDGVTVRTYVNGVLGTTATPANANLTNSDGTLTLGAFSNSSNWFKGMIDEVQVDDHALLPGDGSGGGYLAFNRSLIPEPGTACILLVACAGLVRRNRKVSPQ